MGHVCPRGVKCTFLKQGKCKYTRRESMLFPSHCDRVFIDMGDDHPAEMHAGVLGMPRPNSKHKARAQSVDGFSEIAQSDSGLSEQIFADWP